MPETRCIEVYHPDGSVTLENCVEVSDEELEREANEKIITEMLALADNDIKVPQIGKFLKALARLRK